MATPLKTLRYVSCLTKCVKSTRRMFYGCTEVHSQWRKYVMTLCLLRENICCGIHPVFFRNLSMRICEHYHPGQRARVKTVGDVCKNWAQIFAKSGVPEPRASVEYLVAFVVGEKTLYNVPKTRKLTSQQVQQVNEMCQKRLQHMPVQYILGEWDFKDLVLVLRPPVFIPTPETEELVGHAADSIEKQNLQEGRFLEVGCGSGAITLSLLQKFPQMRAVCLDISSDACHLTKENAERLSLADRLEVYQADVCLDKDLHKLKQQDRFDFIVSNPPYISSEEIPGLEKQIIEYEDLRALDGGPDGLRIVKSILSLSSTLLRPLGEVWLEVDISQPVLIQQYVQEKSNLGLTYVATFQDYLGSNRFCLMRQARQEDKEGSAF